MIEGRQPLTEAQRALCVEHLPQLERTAEVVERRWRYLHEREDLISDGYFGLEEAAARFDPQRGWKFWTYASPRVYGAMVDGARLRDVAPRLVRFRMTKIRETRSRMESELGRPVSEEELIDGVGLTLRQYRDTLRRHRETDSQSLQRVIAEGEVNDLTLADACACQQTHDPGDRVENEDFWKHALRGLNQQQRLLVLMYYREGTTMKKAAEALGVSESRASQVLARLAPQLRSNLKNWFDPDHRRAA